VRLCVARSTADPDKTGTSQPRVAPQVLNRLGDERYSWVGAAVWLFCRRSALASLALVESDERRSRARVAQQAGASLVTCSQTYSGGKTRVTIVTCKDLAVPTADRVALGCEEMGPARAFHALTGPGAPAKGCQDRRAVPLRFYHGSRELRLKPAETVPLGVGAEGFPIKGLRKCASHAGEFTATACY
jgi:hypothetical protein